MKKLSFLLAVAMVFVFFSGLAFAKSPSTLRPNNWNAEQTFSHGIVIKDYAEIDIPVEFTPYVLPWDTTKGFIIDEKTLKKGGIFLVDVTSIATSNVSCDPIGPGGAGVTLLITPAALSARNVENKLIKILKMDSGTTDVIIAIGTHAGVSTGTSYFFNSASAVTDANMDALGDYYGIAQILNGGTSAYIIERYIH